MFTVIIYGDHFQELANRLASTIIVWMPTYAR